MRFTRWSTVLIGVGLLLMTVALAGAVLWISAWLWDVPDPRLGLSGGVPSDCSIFMQLVHPPRVVSQSEAFTLVVIVDAYADPSSNELHAGVQCPARITVAAPGFDVQPDPSRLVSVPLGGSVRETWVLTPKALGVYKIYCEAYAPDQGGPSGGDWDLVGISVTDSLGLNAQQRELWDEFGQRLVSVLGALLTALGALWRFIRWRKGRHADKRGSGPVRGQIGGFQALGKLMAVLGGALATFTVLGLPWRQSLGLGQSLPTYQETGNIRVFDIASERFTAMHSQTSGQTAATLHTPLLELLFAVLIAVVVAGFALALRSWLGRRRVQAQTQMLLAGIGLLEIIGPLLAMSYQEHLFPKGPGVVLIALGLIILLVGSSVCALDQHGSGAGRTATYARASAGRDAEKGVRVKSLKGIVRYLAVIALLLAGTALVEVLGFLLGPYTSFYYSTALDDLPPVPGSRSVMPGLEGVLLGLLEVGLLLSTVCGLLGRRAALRAAHSGYADVFQRLSTVSGAGLAVGMVSVVDGTVAHPLEVLMDFAGNLAGGAYSTPTNILKDPYLLRDLASLAWPVAILVFLCLAAAVPAALALLPGAWRKDAAAPGATAPRSQAASY